MDVNEGPEILRRGNRIFVVYSAAGCWTDNYSMGMLTADAGSNLLDPGFVEEESPAGVLAIALGGRVRHRPREFLPVAGR